uniref:Putative secreted protein n=1 Tax=Anopheles triannulatus TaxID=58253 RepID=A0A2M4B0Y5_9DIPT
MVTGSALLLLRWRLATATFAIVHQGCCRRGSRSSHLAQASAAIVSQSGTNLDDVHLNQTTNRVEPQPQIG